MKRIRVLLLFWAYPAIICNASAGEYTGLAAEIDRIGSECSFEFEVLDKEAAICYFSRLPESAMSKVKSKETLDARLSAIQMYESGRATYAETIQQIRNDIVKRAGISKAWIGAEHKKWVIVALVLDKEIIPNINPSMLFHDSENRCNAAIKNLEYAFGEAVKTGVSFFCKENPFFKSD